MKILISVVLVTTVVSAVPSKKYDIKCTLGPSYWCHSYDNAIECHAVPYCKEKVWKGPTPSDIKTLKSNVSCLACEALETTFKDMLASPAFQKKFLSQIEEGCKRFSDLEPECKALVDKYEPMIFSSIIKMLSNAKKICTELGLCSASKEKVMAVLLSKALPIKMKTFAGITMKKHARNLLKAMPVKSSSDCILCEFIAEKLDQMLTKNATEQQIKSALDKVCSILPSTIKAECTGFVDKYSVMIIQLLSQELSPKMLCTALGLCKGNIKIKKTQVGKTNSNGAVCDICTTAITYLKNLLQDNSTEKEILDGLKQMCSNLPQQIASECTALVDAYGKQILKLIATSDPKTLCKDIGLCASKVKLHNIVGVKNQCYFGASYWCASFHNAVKCNAISFCKKHAW